MKLSAKVKVRFIVRVKVRIGSTVRIVAGQLIKLQKLQCDWNRVDQTIIINSNVKPYGAERATNLELRILYISLTT